MSNVTVLKVGHRPAARGEGAPSEYLGPADVLEVEPLAMGVRLPDGSTVRAELALAFPYQAKPGDVVLVIGRGEAERAAFYVIGVLRGSGETTLTFNGDVRLRAQGGALRLEGDRGVEVRGPELSVVVSTVKVVAESMVQKLGSAYQRVTGLLSLRAGDAHTVVDGASFTKSKSGAILTEEKMTINGKQIHLG